MAIDPNLLAAFAQSQEAVAPSGPYVPSYVQDSVPNRGIETSNFDPKNAVAYDFQKPQYDVPKPDDDFATSFGHPHAHTDTTLPGPPTKRGR